MHYIHTSVTYDGTSDSEDMAAPRVTSVVLRNTKNRGQRVSDTRAGLAGLETVFDSTFISSDRITTPHPPHAFPRDTNT